MKFKTFSEIIEKFKTFACHDIETRVMINLDGLLFEVESISNGFYPVSPITINGKIKSGRTDHRRRRNMSFRLKRVFHLFQLIPLALHKIGGGYQSDDTDQVGECQSSQHKKDG
jgi:hypothetical protein